MSLVPRIFSSTDPGAPALTGQAGSMAALLDAVLVDGYGVGEAAKAGLGWSRVFTAANKRVYRNDVVLGSGWHVRVDDTGVPSNARQTWLLAYESMSSVDTGVNPAGNPLGWPKSTLLSADARPWWVVGNARSAYLFASIDGSGNHMPYFVGDIMSAADPDTSNFCVLGGVEGAWSSGAAVASYLFRYFRGQTSPVGYVGRSADGTLTGVGLHQSGLSNAAMAGGGGLPYDAGIRLCLMPHYMFDWEQRLRGTLPGVMAPLHPRPLPDLYKFDGGVEFGGSEVIAKSFRSGAISAITYDGQVLFVLGEEWW